MAGLWLTATSWMRGHEVRYDLSSRQWLYADTLTPADDSRPCTRCGKMPTPEGYDACLGHVQGATSACCGHGVADPILLPDEDWHH